MVDNFNSFQSVNGSDSFYTLTPSSELIISCSKSYYEAERDYINQQEFDIVGDYELTPEQERQAFIEHELDIIQSQSLSIF